MPSFFIVMKISFNSYQFTAAGNAQFSRSSKFDPEARIGRALRELVIWKIKEMFLEPNFADNQARFADLRAVIGNGEGLLVITDESERVLFSDTVRITSHDLPEQWGQYTTEVSIEFAATRDRRGFYSERFDHADRAARSWFMERECPD